MNMSFIVIDIMINMIINITMMMMIVRSVYSHHYVVGMCLLCILSSYSEYPPHYYCYGYSLLLFVLLLILLL